jgi:chromosome segregation ATPase
MDANDEKEFQEVKREIAALQKDLASTRNALARLQRRYDVHEAQVTDVNATSLKRSVDRLILLVDGDPNSDVEGLRNRLEHVEDKANEIINQRNTLKWILIGMGLTGVTNAGALITVIVKTLGGGP